jgi:hypothetical protein
MRVSWILFLLGISGCGEKLLFEPNCTLPRGSDPMTPTRIFSLGEERVLVLDADLKERYCGGSLRILDLRNGEWSAIPLRGEKGYEAHFLDLVIEGDSAFTLGRRFGTLFRIQLTPPYPVLNALPTRITRIFPGPGGTITAIRTDTSGTTLTLLSPEFTPTSPEIVLPGPVGAVTRSADDSALFVSFLGSEEGVWKLNLKRDLQPDWFAYPLGYGNLHTIRALAFVPPYLYGGEEGAGVLFLLDPETGRTLGIVPGAGKPVEIHDGEGEILLLDRNGTLLELRDQSLTPLLTGLSSPLSFTFARSTLYIAELGGGIPSFPWEAR